MSSVKQVQNYSGCVDFYTPRYIWERAERAMGGIDLDPSSPGWNVNAARHITKEEDGLNQIWQGRVWLNPPFGNDVYIWFEKLRDEYQSGRVPAAVVLWKSATETRAWQTLISYACRVCFPHQRINFIAKNKNNGKGATFSPALFYAGNDPEVFEAAFCDIGDIWITPKKPGKKNQMQFTDYAIGVSGQ